MSMDRYELETIVARMVELIGIEEMLAELTRAQSTDELQANLEFIDRMNDLCLMGNE